MIRKEALCGSKRMKKRKGKIFYPDSDLQKGTNTHKELLIKILSK
jgi:hypothetical protein